MTTSKSAIRIAYDTLDDLVTTEAKRAADARHRCSTCAPAQHGQPQSVRAEIIQELDYSHISLVVQQYADAIEYNKERLAVATQLMREYTEQVEERKQTMVALFQMLPKEEQSEIMLTKLSK